LWLRAVVFCFVFDLKCGGLELKRRPLLYI
jgi:hypothetical protein